MSATRQLARLERLEAQLSSRLESVAKAQRMPVVLLSRCDCPDCSARKSNYDGAGDALLVELGCPKQIPPPIELPSDDEHHDEITTADLPPTPPPRRPRGQRRIGRFVVAN